MGATVLPLICPHCKLGMVPDLAEGEAPTRDHFIVVGGDMARHLRDDHGDEECALTIERVMVRRKAWR